MCRFTLPARIRTSASRWRLRHFTEPERYSSLLDSRSRSERLGGSLLALSGKRAFPDPSTLTTRELPRCPLIAHFAMSGIPPRAGPRQPFLLMRALRSSLAGGLEFNHHNRAVSTITDFPPHQVRECPLIGGVRSVPVSQDGPRSCPKPFSALFDKLSPYSGIFYV